MPLERGRQPAFEFARPGEVRNLVLQFLCAVAGGILLPIDVGAVTNDAAVDLAVIPGTLFTLISMVLFLVVVLRGWRRETAPDQPVAVRG